MKPKDIVNIILIIVVVVLAIDYLTPDNKVNERINNQQRIIDSLGVELRDLVHDNVQRNKQDSLFLHKLDSISYDLSEEDSLQMIQIKLLWKNNYALRETYDSAFNNIPDLPDF